MKSQLSNKKVFVEVAKTPHQLSQGLMFRKNLEPDSGMLFVFEKPKDLSFWGMNTFIPLDIAFIDEGGMIRDIKRIKEHDLNSVKSSCPCKYALEISDGWFNSNGFKVGDYAEPILGEIDGHVVLIKKNIKIAQVKKDDIEEDEEIIDEEKPEIEEKSKEEKPIEVKKDVQKGPLKPEIQKKPLPAVAVEPAERSVAIPKFNNIFDALRWSMSNLEVVRITYHTQKGHTVTKDIEPHKVFFSRSSKQQVLKAYDETADHPSQYIIMNIVSYGFPGRKFTPKSILLNRRIS